MQIWLRLLLVACVGWVVSGCGDGSEGNGSDGRAGGRSRSRLNWAAIPAKYNPRTEDFAFSTSGFDKVDVDAFGFDDDVEIVYSPDVQFGTGFVRVFKVHYGSASFGGFQASGEGRTVFIKNYGRYQCSIRVTNGMIQELEGGCYVRLQIFLPAGAQLEVYNLGHLISRRFLAMDNATFLQQIDRATWEQDKFAVINAYLQSYRDVGRSPSLTTEHLGKVMDEFMMREPKLKALRLLHGFVSDRYNLAAMIEDKFSYFDRPEARRIVGL